MSKPIHDDQSRLVVDPVTGVEVIYAPRRADRSNAFAQEPLQLPASQLCPFCPGNEDETPPAVQVWSLGGDKHWQVRAVPNRFPVVDAQAPASGRHEVLIESPDHHATWLTMSPDKLALVFRAVRERIEDLYRDNEIVCLQVFKNTGTRAGASLGHPHLQIVGLGLLPTLVALAAERSQAYAVEHGHDYHAALIEQSLHHRTTLVHADDDYVTICPPASRVPYEMWIMARHATAYINQSERKFSQHVRESLRLLTAAIGDVAYNIVWQLPTHREPAHRWRLEIIPRLTTFAGLEFGSGLYVNPVPPELAVQRLRGTTQPS